MTIMNDTTVIRNFTTQTTEGDRRAKSANTGDGLTPSCRFCGCLLTEIFADLGSTPLCESYLRPEDLRKGEPFYSLCTYVCSQCYLVQVPEIVSPQEIFSDYAYFSSYSDSWLQHARNYVEQMIPRLGLNQFSQVIEIASNDGYLLRFFKENNIPVLGIEPAANVAKVAIQQGIPTLITFFGDGPARQLAASGKQADLLLGNNVLAHVPDLNGFVEGLRLLLKPQGIITMEFPHLMRLIEGHQFDTIYHEHFSYLSFIAAEQVFAAHGLTIFDVEELHTHGGSLRIFGRHREDSTKPVTARVNELRQREQAAGLTSLAYYTTFSEAVKETKRKLLECLTAIKRTGKTIAAYGAAGKGNTLLNYCGVRTDFIDYVVDRNLYKQGKWLPGTRIPIFAPTKIAETKPDYILILPWNLKEEIMVQLAYIRDWNGKFIIPIPYAEIV